MFKFETINTDYKKIKLDQNCGELCQHFKKIMDVNKGLEGSKKTIAIYLAPIERKFIDTFLKLNQISFAELLRYIYLMDDAMPVAYIEAIRGDNLVTLGFVDIGERGLNTSYFDEYKDYSATDYELKFEERGTAKTAVDRAVLMEEVDIHRKKKGYNTMSAYIKTALIQIVYPPNSREIAKSHIRLDYGKKLSESDLKKKKKRQEKDAEKRVMGFKKPKEKFNRLKMNVSTANLETELFELFQDALNKKGLSVSAIAKYRLIKEGVITEDMVRMSDELLKICEDFTYTPPAPLGDRDWYIQTRRDREGEGRQVNNIAITIPVREAIYANKNIGRGNFSKWCKKNVFDYYNMYPKVDGQSIVDIITSKYRKLKR